MRKLIAVVGLVVAAGWSARADDDADKAAKKLEGGYEVVSATRGGKPDPKADDVKSFVIKDGKITIQVKGKDKDMVAKFKLDPSKKPAEIDIMPQDGGKDEKIPGIYETKDTSKGLELTIAFAGGGSANPTRPKDFKGEGENVMVIKLLRKK